MRRYLRTTPLRRLLHLRPRTSTCAPTSDAGSAAADVCENHVGPVRFYEEEQMSMNRKTARRGIAVLGAAAALAATAVPAAADDPAPNCTAADLAGVLTGVSAALSAYLFTHPD